MGTSPRSAIGRTTPRTAWLAALALLLSGCPCPLPPPTAFDQIEQRVETDTVESFALGELENLPTWTELHLFTPYTSTPDLEARLGFSWPDADHFDLDQRDDIYLAIFVDRDRVVAVGEWPRLPFDLDESLFAGPLTPDSIVHIDRGDRSVVLRLDATPVSEPTVDTESTEDRPPLGPEDPETDEQAGDSVG